jgi:hypothetical protein
LHTTAVIHDACFERQTRVSARQDSRRKARKQAVQQIFCVDARQGRAKVFSGPKGDSQASPTPKVHPIAGTSKAIQDVIRSPQNQLNVANDYVQPIHE